VYKEKLRDLYFSKYYTGDQIKNNKMRWTCGTYGGEEECLQGLGGET